MYFYLFNHCKIVKGAMQSALYDLDRYKYYIVPHSFADFIEEYNGFNIDKLYEIFEEEEHETLSEYIQFLKEKQLAIFCQNPNDTFLINYKFENYNPSHIYNALIEYHHSFDLKHLSYLLDKEGCRHVFFYSFESISIKNIIKLLSSFNNSGIVSIQILMKYTSLSLIFLYKHLVSKYARLLKLILHHAPFDKGYLKYGQFEYHIGCLKKAIADMYSLYEISPYNFNVNSQLYAESQHCNTFFYKKLIIDSSGNIKSNLFSSKFYGNIFQLNSLENLLSNSELKKYWYVRKDDILMCKDCEHRYMCVDSRYPIEIGNNQWKFNTECNYNPYIAKWKGEEGYITVEEWLCKTNNFL
jgi:SPASM domain peptide maturase of grasp-with-spasm system